MLKAHDSRPQSARSERSKSRRRHPGKAGPARFYYKGNRLKQLRAFVLVDMVGGRDLMLDRDTNSTPWLLDAVWQAARKLGVQDHFPDVPSPVEDDHIEFLQAGVHAVDIIDLNHYAQAGWWHTREDTLDKISARSLQIVGDVLMAALPSIEARLVKGTAPSPSKTAPKTKVKAKKIAASSGAPR